MSIVSRVVKNKRNPDGTYTNRSGTVYDVFLRYSTNGHGKSYSKKGFLTRHEAQKHETEMRDKMRDPNRMDIYNYDSKQTLTEYLDGWIEEYGKANLRPNTIRGYRSNITNHIIPHLGQIQLRNLTSPMINTMVLAIIDSGLSENSAKYVHRTLSVALECALKNRYIDYNPAKSIMKKFGRGNETPKPYTVTEMKSLLGAVANSEWEMVIMLGGLYGLRISEILGLRWKNIDLESSVFTVCEQLPDNLPAGTTLVTEMAPLKAGEKRELPITDSAMPYFQRQLAMNERQRELQPTYHDNDLVVANHDGRPKRRSNMSSDFGQLLKKFTMRHVRFHDLRHAAASNIFELTQDFYTVSKILGHTMKGTGQLLGIGNLASTTSQYVDVRLESKYRALTAYHSTIHPQRTLRAKDNAIYFPSAE